MYTNKGIGKGLGLKQIVSIAVIAVCMLTMILPWVYVGMKSTDGDNWDMNSLLEDFTDLDVDYYLDIITDSNITDYLLEALSPASARKELKSARNAVTGVANAVKDSKLSPVETASIFTNLAKLQSFFTKYDDDYAFDFSKNTFLLIGAVQWLIILAFVVLGAYCIFADLTGRKSPFLGAMCVYLVLFSLYAVIAIYGNTMAKRDLGDSFILDLAGIRSPSFLHIQFAPIFGSILMIGNFVFWKLNADGSLGAGIENIGKKMVWKCACGATNPSSCRFCPKCGNERPADFTPVDFKADVVDRLVWTCSCGSTNSKKSAFCPKCGAKRPTDIAAPKPAYTADSAYTSESAYAPRSAYTPDSAYAPKPARTPDPVYTPKPARTPDPAHSPDSAYAPPAVSYCKRCGKPIAYGTKLCRECRAALEAAKRASTSAPPRYASDETIAERKAGTSAETPRIKKTFKTPTSLD